MLVLTILLVIGSVSPTPPELQIYETSYASVVHVHDTVRDGVCGELTDAYRRGCARSEESGIVYLHLHGGMDYADGSCGFSVLLDRASDVTNFTPVNERAGGWCVAFGGPAASELFAAIRATYPDASNAARTPSGLTVCEDDPFGQVKCTIQRLIEEPVQVVE